MDHVALDRTDAVARKPFVRMKSAHGPSSRSEFGAACLVAEDISAQMPDSASTCLKFLVATTNVPDLCELGRSMPVLYANANRSHLYCLMGSDCLFFVQTALCSVSGWCYPWVRNGQVNLRETQVWSAIPATQRAAKRANAPQKARTGGTVRGKRQRERHGTAGRVFRFACRANFRLWNYSELPHGHADSGLY